MGIYAEHFSCEIVLNLEINRKTSRKMEKSVSKSKTKAKTTSKTKKPAAVSSTGKTRKTKASKQLPGENEIRSKAQEIFNERSFRGEHGTPEEDWLNAERLLKG
jgi:transglutaminase/protease-like cytokinesis protein 3